TSAALLMLIEGATLMARMGQPDSAIRDARKAAMAILAAPGRPR
ncbi:MAG: TetR/AcrR family transcriptional regulator, partial [Mesorhizobium sp.]